MNRMDEILSWYSSENPGVRTNLYRILSHGKLAGTGRMLMLPADQGVEHGPGRSFSNNPAAYDPRYHIELAIEAGCNAYVAPLGFLEAVAADYAGQIPFVLKLNGRDLLHNDPDPMLAQFATVEDALRLGCTAVGFGIYPGTNNRRILYEQFREVVRQAKSVGLPVICWSYPRGANIPKEAETAADITTYAAHLAAQMGAHIIYLKLPTERIEHADTRILYEKHGVKLGTLEDRIRHVLQGAFQSRRIVLFSGGPRGDADIILQEAIAIRNAGAAGQMIGRNAFQRTREAALDLFEKLIRVYQGAD
ncbi:MAG: class I fructose-bisphosphate aldolase [Anaerolineales bacterium]|nr:class I fructose-bisphosphate aldolase [Anaerolineales bacterium]